jgi:hypothetical protein
VEDLPKMSTEELLAVANGAHQAFVGSLRGAIKEHARLAGAALLLLKARHKHGAWQEWVDANFKGSYANAKLYMRIARHWPQVVDLGLDRDGFTLSDLRWVFSESGGPRPGTDEAKGKKEAAAGKEGTDGPGEGEAGGAARSEVRQVPLLLTEDNIGDFEDMVRHLQKVFGTDNTTDTVLEAVRRCYKEEAHG